jgi:hypothetical protein
MRSALVLTTFYGKDVLLKVAKAGVIGTNSRPLAQQIPQFRDKPLVYCSYICDGYSGLYSGYGEGMIFETESPIIYACPADTFNLMRSGKYLPGHERFIFSSIDEMLTKYPSSEHFKNDFREYFRSLKPADIYPDCETELARRLFQTDYCLYPRWDMGCNEITLPKPLKIKNPKIFNTRQELEKILWI